MKDNLSDIFLLNSVNGASIAALTLNDVKDGVAVVLGIVSIVSTLLIIRNNLRKVRQRPDDAQKSPDGVGFPSPPRVSGPTSDDRFANRGGIVSTISTSEVRSSKDELPVEKKVAKDGVAIIVILILLGLFGSGCSTLDSLYGKEVQQIPTHSRDLPTSGSVAQSGGEPSGLASQARHHSVAPYSGDRSRETWSSASSRLAGDPESAPRLGAEEHKAPTLYVTNLVPRADVEMGIKAVGAVPVPWAGAVALGLGWLYSTYASLRNKQVAKALVQSVQVGREFLQATPEGQKLDAEVKRLLQRHQEYAGVAREVKRLLEDSVPKPR